MGGKTIWVSDETHERLAERGNAADSMHDVIKRLLDDAETGGDDV